MKNVLFASVLALLVACGQDNQNSTVATSIAPGTELPQTLEASYIFSKDARFVDGNLEELSIAKGKDGSYKAEFKVVTAGFGFPVEENVTKLGKKLACVSNAEPMLGLLSLICSHDLRPVDGYLTEVIVKRAGAKTYDVSLRKVSSGFVVGGVPTEETTIIAEGLEYKN